MTIPTQEQLNNYSDCYKELNGIRPSLVGVTPIMIEETFEAMEAHWDEKISQDYIDGYAWEEAEHTGDYSKVRSQFEEHLGQKSQVGSLAELF